MHYTTQRLEIRDLCEEDWQAVHLVRGDPEVAQFMDFKAENPEETRAWLAESIMHNTASPRFAHTSAILHKDTGEVIGYIGLGRPDESLRDIGDIDFGYALRRDVWGKGYMPEAIKGLLLFSFSILSAGVVFAQCLKKNVRSARVLEKAGMEFLKDHSEARIYITRKDAWKE